jgi:hypothetical protein
LKKCVAFRPLKGIEKFVLSTPGKDQYLFCFGSRQKLGRGNFLINSPMKQKQNKHFKMQNGCVKIASKLFHSHFNAIAIL